MSQLMTVVDDIKSVADSVRHLSDATKSFRVKLEYDEEVVRMTSLFLSAVEGRVESCRQYRNNVFLPYAFLWTENRQRFLQDFLRETNKSTSKDQLVTAEQALSTIIKPVAAAASAATAAAAADEKEGDEEKSDLEGEEVKEDAMLTPTPAQVMMSAPNIPEFEEMVSKYTHIERLVSEMPSSQKFDFLLLDCEPMKNSLRNATGRWTMTFTHYLEQYIDVSVTDFYRFIELVSVGIKGGEIGWRAEDYDQDRLTTLMKYLFTIQQYTKHYENLVEPLQSIVALLRKIGVAVHKVVVKNIDRMRSKWTEMLHQVRIEIASSFLVLFCLLSSLFSLLSCLSSLLSSRSSRVLSATDNMCAGWIFFFPFKSRSTRYVTLWALSSRWKRKRFIERRRRWYWQSRPSRRVSRRIFQRMSWRMTARRMPFSTASILILRFSRRASEE
jgi:hypothetical protein